MWRQKFALTKSNRSNLTNTSGDRCGRRSAAPVQLFSTQPQGSQSFALGLTLAAASQLRTIVFAATQGSQSFALGLTLAAASQLRTIVFAATQTSQSFVPGFT